MKAGKWLEPIPRAPIFALGLLACGPSAAPIASPPRAPAAPAAAEPTTSAAAAAEPAPARVTEPSHDMRSLSASPTTPRTPFTISARFVCDAKQISTCNEGEWMAEIARDPASTNLLAHEEGGPEGAIWNGDAPIVIIVPPSVKRVTIGTFALNGEAAHGLLWFRALGAAWRAQLHTVSGHAYRAVRVRVDGKQVGEIWEADGE